MLVFAHCIKLSHAFEKRLSAFFRDSITNASHFETDTEYQKLIMTCRMLKCSLRTVFVTGLIKEANDHSTLLETAGGENRQAAGQL